MSRGTFSLATLLLFVTACCVFAGLVTLCVRPDRQVVIACWGGLVAMQLLGAAHIRTASVWEHADKTWRQAVTLLALKMTLAAAIVPWLMLPLFLAMEVVGPGVICETLEVIFLPMAIAFVPVAVVAILAAMVLQVIGNFNLATAATQAVSFCATIWPFFYFTFLV